MLNVSRQPHNLAISLQGVAIHGLITLLAVAIAFSLPEVA
jgi:hypothetical protein